MRIPTKLKLCEALQLKALEPAAESWFDRVEGLYTSLDSANRFAADLPILVLIAQANGVLPNRHANPFVSSKKKLTEITKRD